MDDCPGSTALAMRTEKDEYSNPVLWTIGYEGRSPTNLAQTLKANGVRRLVDVRLSPQSRIKGFSLMGLFEHLRKAGIAYEHMKELGNPPEIRALYQNESLEEGKAQFRAFLEDGNGIAVDILIGLASLEPTAILCRERDHSHCHRTEVAEMAIERSGQRLTVKHL